MKEYKIGIIEDDLEELNSIKRTIYIYINLSLNHTIMYKDYQLNNKSTNYVDIIDEIKKDILDDKIMLLIIDNKLVVEGNRLKGTSIYEEVKKITSDFPVIIMTNYKDEAYDSDYVDPDKVYDKEKFFLNGEYTKEKINSICLLVDKYMKLKNNIIAEKNRLIEEYKSEISNEGQDKLNELLKVELEMKKYTPVETTYLEQLISPDYVREIIELLDKNKQLKEQLEASEKARKESMLILGEYRHYTLPTEEQNRENEDIVNKAYNNLILKQDIYKGE